MPDPGLYLRTLRHLKPVQIRYRLYYTLRRQYRRIFRFHYPMAIRATGYPLTLTQSLPNAPVWQGGNRFLFLNLKHNFGHAINWNFIGHGKLWAYHLNYFDFLRQDEMGKAEGLRLIYDFIRQSGRNREGMEPYPLSLRVVNWIKFLSRHQIQDKAIDASLFAQLYILMNNLEFHLMGNHLLENGFALLWGARYFNDDRLCATADEILQTELEEQVLPDGAHFELSPMYHAIMLERVLDAVNLLQNTGDTTGQLLPLLSQKAALMMGWLNQFSFASGEFPLFNDCSSGMAADTKALQDYAACLKIQADQVPLCASGYRILKTRHCELSVDAGPIGPAYLPAHGHCDMLSFVLMVDGDPYLVDTGVSTYETGPRRQYERSTAAHNTVTMDGTEQSEIWGSFRVGRRAKIDILKDTSDQVIAQHNGFASVHRRRFSTRPQDITIEDWLLPGGKGIARFHFTLHRKVILEDDQLICDALCMRFSKRCNVWLESYQYAVGFNRLATGDCVCVAFNDHLLTEIDIKT
ncbi:alginate lyase family protein [uncultured Desulfosarcina sp.]|uniref:alginate lyase family protein n=1 Tax=uncultured Desulfosarcina sp. TaxID=218289 RepID=UPI0029C61776|nr:alginate lyase family protein [uncultured Desulfosarcina sp.]